MAEGKGKRTAENFLRLLYQAVGWGQVAANSGSQPASNIYYGLNDDGMTGSGSQVEGEAAYVGYARQAVARTTGACSVVGSRMSPLRAITFPQAQTEGPTLTQFHTGLAKEGSGDVLHFGILIPQVRIHIGVMPQLTSDTYVEEL